MPVDMPSQFRPIRHLTARKPFLLAEGVVGAIGLIATIAPDFGHFTVARLPLAILCGVLFLLFVTGRIAGDRVRDVREGERDAQLKRMEDALSRTPLAASPPLLPSDPAAVEALREHTAALREAGRQARYAEIKQTLYDARTDRAEGAI